MPQNKHQHWSQPIQNDAPLKSEPEQQEVHSGRKEKHKSIALVMHVANISTEGY